MLYKTNTACRIIQMTAMDIQVASSCMDEVHPCGISRLILVFVNSVSAKEKGMVAHPLKLLFDWILESVVEIHVDLGRVVP